MSKSRSFAKSNVDINKHLNDQVEVEKSLKLRRDYEEKFTKFQDSFINLVKTASPYASKIDFNLAINDDGENFAASYRDAVEQFARKLSNTYTSSFLELKYTPEELENLIYNFRGYDSQKNLIRFINNKNRKDGWEILKLNKVINEFLDAYEAVLNMDTRTVGEKAASTKEYMSELRNKVKKDGVSAAQDIAKDAIKIITDHLPSSVDVQQSASYAFASMFASVSNVASFFGNFMKTEDQKEIEKSIREEKEEADLVIEISEEVATINENENTKVATISEYVKPAAPEAIKITDSKITNNWHKQFQDKLSNFIEITKTQCFSGATKMQEEANICQLKSIDKLSQECESQKEAANLVMKNCAVMFPMESNYDEMISKMLNFAMDARVNISENGDMTYLAVGLETSKDNAYIVTDVNQLPMPDSSANSQFLGAGVDGNHLAIEA